jgi:hypothetical protein
MPNPSVPSRKRSARPPVRDCAPGRYHCTFGTISQPMTVPPPIARNTHGGDSELRAQLQSCPGKSGWQAASCVGERGLCDADGHCRAAQARLRGAMRAQAYVLSVWLSYRNVRSIGRGGFKTRPGTRGTASCGNMLASCGDAIRQLGVIPLVGCVRVDVANGRTSWRAAPARDLRPTARAAATAADCASERRPRPSAPAGARAWR